MIAYFQARPDPVLLSAFLHFGAAMVLGIFTAGVVRRLRTLGVKGMAPDVALFGGLAASFNMASAALVQWVLAQARHRGGSLGGAAPRFPPLRPRRTRLFRPAGPPDRRRVDPRRRRTLLPRWVVVLGLVLAVVGVLSGFSMVALSAG